MRPPLPSERDPLKRAAAARAVTEVEDGMILGLGSGSTAAFAIEALAARIAKGLRVVGIPTSEKTAALARRLGVPLTSFAASMLRSTAPIHETEKHAWPVQCQQS